MGIKERLREAMEAHGFNIKELSEKVGIPYRSLQNYLRGEREPNTEALIAIGTQMGISIDWLLTGRGLMRIDEMPSAPESSEQTFSQSDLKLLELMNQLDPDVRRDLLRGAEEKQRIIDMEKQLTELSAELERVKKTG
ncbi:helix-turn-helix domain-containing protein [Pectobacterium versatile]|uniref:helix-turn-helix domain-containing protein n=1 Tax=Pectobacterium versatile TaxID=2488639 RepID=UPI001CF59AA1|nr:helix-turn-helix domain-containing protein [Pectobacterium versatile]MCA6927773.1 helix-turn-helix domain-containing protein [Pectobacterium versatile]MCH5084519.1 helix-turn-helix domain-containing protein [Pectobacterium versatile]